jgi:hypothetical protein
VQPINGLHPYTKDRWTGQRWLTDEVMPWTDPCALIPDIGNRISAIDGQSPILTR